MIAEIDARSTVLAVARAHKWVEEKGDNRGQAVEAILRTCGLPPGEPWCAAFVAYIGRAVLGSDWPMPLTGRCQTLSDAGVAQGKLMASPSWGSIFLLWSEGLHRFRHTGFVIMPKNGDHAWLTVEGNTNQSNSPEGTGVFERTRTFAPSDRFISWWL